MESLFGKMLKRFTNVGSKQFWKDFLRDFMLKKTLAHRKMVLIRKNKQEKNNAKIMIKQFEEDSSSKKVNTHSQLKTLLLKYGEAYLWTIYQMAELKQLPQ